MRRAAPRQAARRRRTLEAAESMPVHEAVLTVLRECKKPVRLPPLYEVTLP